MIDLGELFIKLMLKLLSQQYLNFGDLPDSDSDSFVGLFFGILTNGCHTPLRQYKHPYMVRELIKLTREVCRGLPCYAASPEKLFSFLEKITMGLPG